MAVSPGTQLGTYEILSHIGSGGMGDVYRARDTKLRREVAIKVLPDAFAQNPERLARFEREAHLLAALNHPNIATIHGLEESGGTHYLIMEMVPGDTLAERIQHDGAVPIEEALGIATQIAEALEHAHEKGVIHRDLKPANVKVTPDGKVKVLDFGLAKAFAGDAPGTDLSSLPTLSASVTREGVILGTAAYMSPEQARGKEVDKRTDIWAFGCVLYELLTGRQAFQGESITDIIAAILKGEPEWQALPETTPAKVRDLLRRCLQKDLRRRQQHIDDARIEMEEALSTPATAGPAAAPIPARTSWRQVLPWGIVFLVVGAIIASIAVWNLNPEAPRPVSRFALTLSETELLGSAAGYGLNEPVVALSPDGTRLVYVANQQLYLRPMDSLEARLISGTEGAISPFFSPDGQWVGFFAEGKLKKVSVSGGAVLTLCDAPGSRGGSWGTDKTIVFGKLGAGLLQVSAAGGTPQELTTLKEGEAQHFYPHSLPGGKAVLFNVRTGLIETSRIEVLLLETGEQRELIQGGTHARYVPTGHLVYAQAGTPGTLLAVPFDLERLEVTGNPVPIVEGVMQLNTSYLAQFSFSHLGTLVYVPAASDLQGGMTLVWVDRTGAVEPLAAPPRQYRNPTLSPDGQRLAVTIPGLPPDVWVYDIARHTLIRLTFEGDNRLPIWTPDGKRVTFRSNRAGGPWNLFWKSADGSGTAERLATSERTQTPSSWSPDGRLLAFYDRIFTGGTSTTEGDIWVLPLEGDPSTSSGRAGKPQPFLQTQFYEAAPMFSPDGRRLAYVSNESGKNEVYVQPFPGPGGKRQISTDGGAEPVWARNGRELFYRNGSQMMAVEIATEPTFSAGLPRLLFEGNFQPSAASLANYDVTPDGQRFVMIQEGAPDSPPPQINVVLNWFEELKRRVPSGQ
ncbi:MAG: serine/threonine-protein kinase [Acidobacteria bacterium]|nr:serine/threonine-protein kinase [Acidobacteriota bacterium]